MRRLSQAFWIAFAARPLIPTARISSRVPHTAMPPLLPDQSLREIPCTHHINVIGVRFRLGALGRTWHARSRNHRRKPRLEQVVQKQTHENSDAEAHGETVLRAHPTPRALQRSGRLLGQHSHRQLVACRPVVYMRQKQVIQLNRPLVLPFHADGKRVDLVLLKQDMRK